MKPSGESTIERRRRLSAEYDAKHGIVRREDTFRPLLIVPSVGISDMGSGPHRGQEKSELVLPALAQESSGAHGKHSPGDEHEEMRYSPEVAMKLPSVDEIVARRRRLSQAYEAQDSERAQREKEEAPTPALMRALEAAGCCATPRTSGRRRQSLDKLADSSDDSSTSEDNQVDMPSVNQVVTRRRSLSRLSPQKVKQEQTPIEKSKDEVNERVAPPRDCGKVFPHRKKREMCTGPGFGRHIFLVPSPKRRVEVSEFYVEEMVIVKRDRHIWVFARVKVLTCRGIRAWIPSAELMVIIPTELMYSHLRKLEDNELQEIAELVYPPAASQTDNQGNQEERIPLPATFDSTESLKVMKPSNPRRPQKQIVLVRPAHLAHRTLYQPLQPTLLCSICLQFMSPMEVHKPWDCDHSCHLSCFELVIQRSGSSSCIACFAEKSWHWKSIQCQCGFTGFVQRRVDDTDPPIECPSCHKLSPILVPYQAPPSPGLRVEMAPAASCNNNPVESSPSLSSDGGWGSDSEDVSPCRTADVSESKWRHITCECGLRAIVRANPDPSKPPMCPACLNPVLASTMPCKSEILKTILGYTPPSSPPSLSPHSPSRPSFPSPLTQSSNASSESSSFSLFNGVKKPSISPSDLSAPGNTPSPQSTPSPPLSHRFESSTSSSSPVISPVPSASTVKVTQFTPPAILPSQSQPSHVKVRPYRPKLLQPGNKELISQSSARPLSKPPRSPDPSPSPSTGTAGYIHLPSLPSPRSKPHQLPTDSLSFRISPAQIRQKMKDEAKKETSGILLESKATKAEAMRSISSSTSRDMPADSMSMWITPTKIKQRATEQEAQQRRQYSSPKLNQVSQPSLSSDSVPMGLALELMKEMAMEEETRQQQTQPASTGFDHLPPRDIARKFPNTESVSMWMTPDLISQTANEEEIRQQHESLRSSSKPIAPMEDELLTQQILRPKPPRTELPTDSVSLWMTPAKIKQLAIKEDIEHQRQDPPVSLGNELFSSYSRIEEEIPTLGLQDPSTSHRQAFPTDSMSFWMTPERVKHMQELQEIGQYNHQLLSVTSDPETLVEDNNGGNLSQSQPQPIFVLKRLPFQLQDIPEYEEVTHRLSPATPKTDSSTPSSSSCSSSSSAQQLPESMNLAARLHKFKSRTTQTVAPHTRPNDLNEPDEPSGIPDSGWITIVRDGQANTNPSKQELEMKIKKIEKDRGLR